MTALEMWFIALVGGMSVLAGVFAVYVLLQQFRNNPRRRRSGSRPLVP